jgi:hypothetical protein
MPADPSRERAREIVAMWRGHDRLEEEIASALDAARREERAACIKATCVHCVGGKPKALPDYGGRLMHLRQGFPPIECRSAQIRALEGDDGR